MGGGTGVCFNSICECTTFFMASPDSFTLSPFLWPFPASFSPGAPVPPWAAGGGWMTNATPAPERGPMVRPEGSKGGRGPSRIRSREKAGSPSGINPRTATGNLHKRSSQTLCLILSDPFPFLLRSLPPPLWPGCTIHRRVGRRGSTWGAGGEVTSTGGSENARGSTGTQFKSQIHSRAEKITFYKGSAKIRVDPHANSLPGVPDPSLLPGVPPPRSPPPLCRRAGDHRQPAPHRGRRPRPAVGPRSELNPPPSLWAALHEF